jgi:phosphatidylserine decarboxylase
MRIAEGSRSWILAPLLGGLIFLFLSVFISSEFKSVLLFISFLLFVLSGIFLIFFRDPERTPGTGIVAVADGVIRHIENITDEDVGPCLYISTFMNIHNVHVNRVPFNGTMTRLTHQPGSHLPAFTKESKRNERFTYLLQTEIGIIKIVQIAGTIARRIVPYVSESAMVHKGDRLGMIRLGSRVDIYLPSNHIVTCLVKKGSIVKAGVDCLAKIHD